jgi:hypothetical protein
MPLHPNQERAVAASVANSFASGIHSHATGTGKSWIALEIIDRFLQTVATPLIFWICEQKSILEEQFAATTLNSKGYSRVIVKFLVHDFTKTKPSNWPSLVNQAAVWRRPQLVIINRAFLTSQERYKALRKSIDLVIHDECHSIRNRTSQDFYSHMRPVRVIGFSATPCTDYEPLTQIISHYSIADAVADGVILPPTIHWLKSHHKITDAHVRTALKVLFADQPYKKAVIWCGMIEYCHQAAKEWAADFPDFLIATDTSMEGNYEAFAAAESNALLFCAAKHREGSDILNLDTCVFLDRVADRGAATFVQCAGRVLRRDPANRKRTGLILDVAAASSIKICDRMNQYLAANCGASFPFTYKLTNWPPIELHTLKMCFVAPEPERPRIADLRTYFVRNVPEAATYQDRLAYELNLIVQKDLAKYLLRATEILSITAGIPHVTRGSCGSSLVVYLLGISHVDPVKYNISFARFLNEFRDTLPDIDFDFPYNLRDEVFLQLHQRWPGQIARISNENHYHEKSALRQAAREAGIKGNASTLEVLNQMRRLSAPTQAAIRSRAAELKDQFRGYSLHCGGIIFYPNGIPADLRIGNRTIPQVALDKYAVAEQKHFKIDILSSRALAILYECMNHEPIDFESWSPDDEVANLFCSGDNIGIILGESPLIRKAFRHFKPRTIDDLALCLAIIRPAAREAKTAVTTADLTATRVYDDDAITLIAAALSCTEAEADKWRRGLTKGDQATMHKFAQALKALEPAKATRLVKQLEGLRDYSFCKAHAYSYAQLVWRLAWCKAHRPRAFWRAVMRHSDSYYRRWVHVYEARLAGVMADHKGTVPSIFAANRRRPNATETATIALRRGGTWTGLDFFPNCGVTPDCRFRGIIASTRIIGYGKIKTAVVCLGIGPKQYIEVLLRSKYLSLANKIGIQGRGSLLEDGCYLCTSFTMF